MSPETASIEGHDNPLDSTHLQRSQMTSVRAPIPPSDPDPVIHELTEPATGPATRPWSAATLCVTCYGPHSRLADRFLSSLYACTDPSRFTLRAGLNEVEPGTRRLFDQYAERYGNIDLFIEPRNIFKNPLMRRLFHEAPLTTPWTLWCDDDTHFTAPDWMQRLEQAAHESPDVSMFGALYYVDCGKRNLLEWIRAARWYRSVPFVREEQADGSSIVRFVFATGGFWALRTAVIRELDWPDRRLIHAGEDFLLSEALRQNGYQIAHFDEGVRINDAPRRNPRAPQVLELPRR